MDGFWILIIPLTSTELQKMTLIDVKPKQLMQLALLPFSDLN